MDWKQIKFIVWDINLYLNIKETLQEFKKDYVSMWILNLPWNEANLHWKFRNATNR